MLNRMEWGGVTHPVNSVQDFVLTPLASAPNDLMRRITAMRGPDHAGNQTRAWAIWPDMAMVAEAPTRHPRGTFDPRQLSQWGRLS
jgi:hypothetical protein